jgi:hypothetical protein
LTRKPMRQPTNMRCPSDPLTAAASHTVCVTWFRYTHLRVRESERVRETERETENASTTHFQLKTIRQCVQCSYAWRFLCDVCDALSPACASTFALEFRRFHARALLERLGHCAGRKGNGDFVMAYLAVALNEKASLPSSSL